MTRKEILAKKPGREFDAKIAVEFFGWRWFRDPLQSDLIGLWPPESPEWQRWNWRDTLIDVTGDEESWQRFSDWDRMGSPSDRPPGSISFLPHYSTSIADAWPVVELLKGMGKVVIVKADALMRGDFEPSYWVQCGNQRDGVRANTAPDAICKAGLLALVGCD